MKIFIYPYKMGSKSAKLLSPALGAKKVFPDRNYRYRPNHLVVNWGNGSSPLWYTTGNRVLNSFMSVRNASNKLESFKKFSEANVSCPEWTTDREIARSWELNGDIVFSRTILNGHSGNGIVQGVVDAPLYTKYFKRKHEYRIHVFRDSVIDAQQKRRREGIESNNFIRNHGNGWVFCREGVIVPTKVLEQSIKAVRSLGLDFGAVDVGYNEHYDEACVFEVNTAPGLEGTTLEKYCEAFKHFSENCHE